MSTFSNIIFAVRNALAEIHNGHLWQLARFPFSILLTVPPMMLSSGFTQLRLPVMLLLSVALSFIAFKHSFSRQGLSELSTNSASSPALRALSKFLTPTSSIWPQTYLSIAHAAEELPRHNVVRLQLEVIFREIRQGIIELRNPSEDLPQLIKGQLRLDGWNFKLDISWRNRMKIWTWAMSDELSPFPEEAFPKLSIFTDEENISYVERSVLGHYCSLFFERNDDIVVWPSLDTIPRAFIETFIRSSRLKLKTKYSSQKVSVSSFTTCEAGLSIFDDDFFYVSLPFSRVFSKRTPNNSYRAVKHQGRLPGPRCSTPLFTRLPEILSLLTSGPNALRVLSLSNGSVSYASALEAHATALEYNEVSRRECIKDVGIQGWREERMYARWEAALLRAGLLTRWVVLLEPKE